MPQSELDQFLGQGPGLVVSLAGGDHYSLLATDATPHPDDGVAIQQGWTDQDVITSGFVPGGIDPVE